MEEKPKRISSAGGDSDEAGGRDADHLTTEFLIIVQKYHIDSISRTDGVMIGRN
jgi:hypothetical protein